MTASSEIIAHYRAKGLKGVELLGAIERHRRLLRGLDPSVANQLEQELRDMAR